MKAFNNLDLKSFDSFLAVGGGSVIDVAKALAIIAQFGGHIRDYSGINKVPAPLERKVLAVPTTSGTGSEISDGAVFIDRAMGMANKEGKDNFLDRAPYQMLDSMLEEIRISARLRDFGYQDDHMPVIVRETFNSVQCQFNPREPSEEDIVHIVKNLI